MPGKSRWQGHEGTDPIGSVIRKQQAMNAAHSFSPFHSAVTMAVVGASLCSE